MALNNDASPHIRDKFAPLSELAARALRRYGDGAAETVDGETMHLMLDLANEIIEEVRQHPYFDTKTELDYYQHITDSRPISDLIIIHGLVYRYAVQQASDKQKLFLPMYYQLMNRVLWDLKNGNKAINFTVVDGGSNPRNKPSPTTTAA